MVIKSNDHDDDDVRMGLRSSRTNEEERSQDIGITEFETAVPPEITADIERVNTAGPWPYPGFGNTWRWVREANSTVEEKTSGDVWSETAPGLRFAHSEAE